MVRIVLILVIVAIINAAVWGIGFVDAMSSMGGRGDWSPVASRTLSLAGQASLIILRPFFLIDRYSPSLALTCVSGVLLEAALLEVALRLYGVGKDSPE